MEGFEDEEGDKLQIEFSHAPPCPPPPKNSPSMKMARWAAAGWSKGRRRLSGFEFAWLRFDFLMGISEDDCVWQTLFDYL